MLLRKGIDYYMKSDNGRSAIDDLRAYDKDTRPHSRDKITRITNTLLRETDFDPLNVQYCDADYETLVLWSGLPFEDLKYILSQDSRLVSTENCFDLIYENIVSVEASIYDFESYIDLLLRKYEALRCDPSYHNGDQWLYRDTLLQALLEYWIIESIWEAPGTERKICQSLALTTDLYRIDDCGTCLDMIASLDQDFIQPWLDLLVRNGIDISEYLQFEFDQHPDGVIYQADLQCCRLITLQFQYDGERITGVEVDNVCDPNYAHFHPAYRCEVGKRRKYCITQLHDVILDEGGKPKQSVPGSWSQTLKLNSELFLIIRFPQVGKEYVEHLEDRDLVWNEESGTWKEYRSGELRDY